LRKYWKAGTPSVYCERSRVCGHPRRQGGHDHAGE
jgi:hypothetical protein